MQKLGSPQSYLTWGIRLSWSRVERFHWVIGQRLSTHSVPRLSCKLALSWKGLCCGAHLWLNASQHTFYRHGVLSCSEKIRFCSYICFHPQSQAFLKKSALAKTVCVYVQVCAQDKCMSSSNEEGAVFHKWIAGI